MRNLKKEILDRIEMVFNQMDERDRLEVADNYYYTNGGKARDTKAIRENKEQLLELIQKIR